MPFIEDFLKPFTSHYQLLVRKPSAVIAQLGGDFSEIIKEVCVMLYTLLFQNSLCELYKNKRLLLKPFGYDVIIIWCSCTVCVFGVIISPFYVNFSWTIWLWLFRNYLLVIWNVHKSLCEPLMHEIWTLCVFAIIIFSFLY